METAEHTKEAGHFYHKDGTPAYTIVGKNGKERNTTLRDARKEGLLPSVTSIIRCAAAPGLELWKSQQVLMAALTTDRLPEETEQQFIDRIIRDSQEQAMKARERGTHIHSVLQDWFSGGLVDVRVFTEGEWPFIHSVMETIHNSIGSHPWICEEPFATEKYGGKVDMHTSEYLIDIKTSLKPISEVKMWPEHYQQLSAYRHGLFGEYSTVRCGILFVNTDSAESRLILAEEELLMKGLRCFNALLDYYYASTGL